MRRTSFSILGAALLLGVAAHAETSLRSVDSFSSIADPAARSQALFEEAGKVIQHPRCVNCHPAGNRPLQGNDGHLHIPAVQRGEGNMGVAGLRCTTCHTQANFDAVRMPGHPQWHLAPIEMAWQGMTLGQICEQIKDPARNGDKSMIRLIDHMAHDSLVGWGWQPGAGRDPVPGTQAEFGALIQAWADTGAHCP